MNRWLPFWIADPVGAERKLDRLASDGYRLTKMNFCGFCTFDKGESRTVRHRIVLERGGLPHGAAERGWEPLYNGRLFYVTAHEDEKETISYGAHKKLHSIAKTLIFFVICFFFGILLGGTLAALDDEFYGSPDSHKALAGFAVSLGVFIHFHIGTKRMPSDGLGLGGKMKTVPAENFIYDKKTEKRLIREGQVKRVLKPGWFYAPDKGEEYVRDMAAQGWIFYRFDEMGVTFYFRKGEPRKLKFVVDYQNHADEGYFNTAKEYGWKLEFTSMTRTMGFTMWSKYWDDEEEEPEFYSDAESEYKRARRFAIVFGLLLAYIIFVGVWFITGVIKALIVGEATLGTAIWVLAVYSMLIAEGVLFSSKTIGYYLRVRKKTGK